MMKAQKLLFLLVVLSFIHGYSQDSSPPPVPLMKIKEGVNIQNSSIRDSIMNKFG